MIERQTEIERPGGAMGVFVCHPERGGPHPAILFFMDAPGIREELRDMARQLATVGYYVLLPNLYYRVRAEELFGGPDAVSRDKMFELMNDLTIAKVMEDADALLAFAGRDPAAADGPVGTLGYCMSGQHAVNAAARHPDRIAAAASIYGTRLVTDKPDSPHLMARRAEAELYFACAENDDYAPLDMVAALQEALDEDKVDAEVEIYPEVGHGFAFPQRGAYDRPAAERHWERLFALFGRNLRPARAG